MRISASTVCYRSSKLSLLAQAALKGRYLFCPDSTRYMLGLVLHLWNRWDAEFVCKDHLVHLVGALNANGAELLTVQGLNAVQGMLRVSWEMVAHSSA